MVKTRLMAVVLSALMILTLAASVPASSSEEKVQLVMIESLGNPARTPAMRAILDEFTAKNPNIEIELISPPLEGADQKIAQMLMAKSDLDILECRFWTTRQFINNGWIQPITDLTDQWDGYATIAESMEAKFDNEVWGLPIGSYQRMIYYRADWFAEKGIEIPEGTDWTFDKLYEIALEMTDPENGRYGWTLRGSGNSYQQFVMMAGLAAIGSDVLGIPDEMLFTKDGASVYRLPGAKKGFEWQKKFYEDCSPKDSIAWGFTDQVDAFASGYTAMLMQDSDCVGIFEERMEPGSWATVPMPVAAETGQGMIGIGSDFWGMTSYTKNRDAAWQVLSFIGNDINSTRFCKAYGVIPPHTNADQFDPTFSSGAYAPFVYMFSHPEMYFATGDSFQPYSGFHAEFGKTADTDVQNVLLGKEDMDKVLAKWADMWEAARAEYGTLADPVS